ncbi:putative alpha-ketoglutarate-dependent sulfonate dioxygenase [Periconia macrospinosa]|uniref:Putative alpha-ketoglutarate-dependent sulfonate dioxygenase n=1 Tax=Periconia macrospinosa TaxID=97972 RepID=A0A2V1DPY6_9PLEO|nr:putative alpha-ketoglutarate-dependent sulfonate dioxygenase [Periconia macrospinosa]
MIAPTESKTTQAKEPLYPDYLPHYDPLDKVVPVGEFEHDDPGHRADPAMQNLLKTATDVFDLSPHCGSELRGVQITELSSEGLDELALLVAQRGCVVLREQKYLDVGFDEQKRIASHFGPLHKHGWMPHPKNGPEEFVIVYDSKDDLRIRKSWARKSPIQFHVDQSPESQPPGLTFFCMLESPDGPGGDTIISNMHTAFMSLSPSFRKRLEGLNAVHTTANPILREIRDNGNMANLKRGITKSIHPVVTVHPVTGQKALFVNSSYTQSIVGWDEEESDYMLKFLFDYINRGQNFACRVRYAPGTIVLWDQRITQHSQTLDYAPGDRRHAFRLTALANKPIPSKIDEDDGECAKDEGRVMLNLC